MKKKIEVTDKMAAEAEPYASAAVVEALESKGMTFLLRRFLRDGKLRQRFAGRMYEKFLAQGGKAGDWQAFLDWLLKNLPTIIAILMALFV